MDSLSGTYILSEQEKLMVDALIGKGLCKLGIHGMDWAYRQSSQAITRAETEFNVQLRDVLNRKLESRRREVAELHQLLEGSTPTTTTTDTALIRALHDQVQPQAEEVCLQDGGCRRCGAYRSRMRHTMLQDYGWCRRCGVRAFTE